MKNGMKIFLGLGLMLALGACNNFFHDLIPPDGNRIISFKVDGQIGEAAISEYTVLADIGKEANLFAIVPKIVISTRATILPVTFEYIHSAFPSVDIFAETKNLHTADNLSDYVINLIKNNPDFNIPAINIPINFSGPVDFLVISAQGNIRQYKVSIKVDSGEPKLIGLNFAKYDNPELVKDAIGVINESSHTINALALYPVEMPFLSYAIIPSFEIIGDKIEVDGNEIISGQSEIQFTQSLGTQNKTITVWRNGMTAEYSLSVIFDEDPDTVRSITDFRFNKADNAGIAANAVASIINTENTGVINVQVFYSGIQPSLLIPRFISPGNVSVNGAAQTSGMSDHGFTSPLEYRIVSRDGQYARIYTVKTEFISVTEAAPRFLSFRFARNVNPELVQDTVGEISDGLIMIDAHYGGSFAPETLIPEFSAQGLVTVLSSVQISGSSAQNFNSQIKYTVTNPLNPVFTRDYWVQTRMLRDTSSDAKMDTFGFYPEDNPGLSDVITGKIDQITGKIVVYAPVGSGVTTRLMIPRFTGSGLVYTDGVIQNSGVSGLLFNVPVIYTVVSANGVNRLNYTVEVRELTSRIHVNADAFGNNDGTTWQNAFRSLKAACEAAAEFPEDIPVEIWIAKGTYTPGTGAADYFPLTANTDYIGGFAGNETAKSQRNTASNITTITGNFNGINSRRLFSCGSVINGDLSFENLYFTAVRGITEDDSGIYSRLNNLYQISVTDCNFIDLTVPGAAVNVQGGSAVISKSTFTNCAGGAVNVKGVSARIIDINFSSCSNLLVLDCSGETEITQVEINGFSGNAISLTGNGNKTLGTIEVISGQNGLSVNNTTGNFRAQDVTLQNLSGVGVSMTGVNGVKNLSGINARNIGIDVINCTNSGSGSFTLTGGDFNNTGAVLVNGASVSILNTTITGSKAESALDITAGGSMIINEVNINGVPGGRGISMTTNGSAAVSNTIIKNCVTVGNGGGMIVSGTGSANISGTNITGCKANIYGGGIYITCTGNVVVSNSVIDTVSLTSTNGSGGGIYRSGGSLKLENSTVKNITGNGDNFAGIYAAGNLEISGLELQNISKYGINTGNGTIKLSGITAANINGGYGVYIASMTSGSFSLSDSRFNGCTVYCTAAGDVPIQVTGTVITNATGSNDGIYARTGTGTITIDWVNIDDIPNGRGIYISSTGGNIISNSTIKNIKISSSGGGIYITNGTSNISNTTIENVEALNGAGIYNSGGQAEISGVNIRNAKADNNGGGIYSTSKLTIRDSTLELCQAATSYGAVWEGASDSSIINTKFINCISGNDYKILNSNFYSIIRDCEFTHDAALPNPEMTSSRVTSLFGRSRNFEHCTFNNLKCYIPMDNYMFTSWFTYPSTSSGGVSSGGGNLILKNCTFNIYDSFTGILALHSGQSSGPGREFIEADSLLMEGNIINSNIDRRLIWLEGNTHSVAIGNFLFLGNVFNGTRVDETTVSSTLRHIIYIDGARPVFIGGMGL